MQITALQRQLTYEKGGLLSGLGAGGAAGLAASRYLQQLQQVGVRAAHDANGHCDIFQTSPGHGDQHSYPEEAARQAGQR